MSFLLTLLMVAMQFFTPKATYRNHDKALLPDPKVTPGVMSSLSKDVVCSTKWGQDARHVTPEMKDRVCVSYGLKPHCYGHTTYEIDHLVSRELGGIDDIKNLWPQPYFQHPGAHEKDTVENWLHKQVCLGKISLPDAQRQIATDWYQVYLTMESAK